MPSFGGGEVDRYDQEIRFTDLHIARLFDDLKARGLWDKTVIVVTGNHGEGFGEHGVLQHGYHLYAPQTKVPLIVRHPRVRRGVWTTAVGHMVASCRDLGQPGRRRRHARDDGPVAGAAPGRRPRRSGSRGVPAALV